MILMFHHYNLNEKFTITDPEKMLCILSNSPDVTCLIFKALLDKGIVSDGKRFRANFERNLLSKFFTDRRNSFIRIICKID